MKKVLIAVDDTRTSRAAISTFYNSVQDPEEVIVLHVQRLEGRSLMTDMLGQAEISTLKDALAGTEYKKALDKKAQNILDCYRKELEGGPFRVKTVVRDGIPAEEILAVAEEEGVELIILGSSGKKGRLTRLIGGSVSRDVGKNAKAPVLVAKRANLCEEPYTWGDASAAITVTMAVLVGLLILGIFLHGGKLPH